MSAPSCGADAYYELGTDTHLIAGGAAGFELFGIVPLAVELVLVDTVGQVDEQFGASGALEAGRMPLDVLAKLGRHDAERTGRNVAVTSVTLLPERKFQIPRSYLRGNEAI